MAARNDADRGVPTGPMRLRNFRCGDALWAAGHQVAFERDEDLSEALRRMLEAYVAGERWTR